MKKYKPPSSDLTADSIKQFVQSYLDGTLKVVLLSVVLPCVHVMDVMSCVHSHI